MLRKTNKLPLGIFGKKYFVVNYIIDSGGCRSIKGTEARGRETPEASGESTRNIVRLYGSAACYCCRVAGR
jgi:hypothetical protein